MEGGIPEFLKKFRQGTDFTGCQGKIRLLRHPVRDGDDGHSCAVCGGGAVLGIFQLLYLATYTILPAH